MKFSATVLLAAAAAAPLAAAARPTWDQLDGYTFERYQQDFGKAYDLPQEAARRAKVFEANLADVQAHNAAGLSWRRGVNVFTDRTEDERRAVSAGLDRKVYFAEQVRGLDFCQLRCADVALHSYSSTCL